MKVDKGDVLTFRFRVEDEAAASPFLGELLEAMRVPHRGVSVTASAREDVLKERDLLAECAEAHADLRARLEAL